MKKIFLYDAECSVQLVRRSPEEYTLMVSRHGSDSTRYDLPLMMTDLGCTRGELLTWLQEQPGGISFPRKERRDKMAVIPKPRLLMQEVLIEKYFGKKQKQLLDKFYYGSRSQHTVSLYRAEDEHWLISAKYWRDEYRAEGDAGSKTAIRDEFGVFMRWEEESLLSLADQTPTISQASLCSEIRIYHEDIDLSVYGKAREKLYRWNSSCGHDSQSWDCRRRDMTLHETNGRWYVIDRVQWIHGTTQDVRWITTVLRLRPGRETESSEEIDKVVMSLPCRTPDFFKR